MFHHLLIPTDGSELSLAAAEHAMPLARLANARVHVLYVIEPYPYAGIGEARLVGQESHLAAARADAARSFERIGDVAQRHGVRIEPLIVEDAQVGRGIVEAAHSCGADLIVMGSHGRSGMARLVLGSVATKVLALSPLPVLIVK